MQRPLRALVLMLLVAVAYNVLVVVGEHVRAPVLLAGLRLTSHGRGFTLGISAGCLATNEVGLLASVTAVILVVTWPLDVVHFSFALVGGGLLGVALRSFMRAHHEPVRDTNTR